MSRLDVQLDQVSGEKTVRIDWPSEGTVDLELLRAKLILEIDQHSHRIPLDLRGVKGAPPELVTMILDLRRYAISKSKHLSTNWILPPMREALEKGRRRSAESVTKPTEEPTGEAASQTATEVLKQAEEKPEYSLATAKKIKRRSTTKKNAKGGFRFLKLGIVILAASLLIAGVEFVVLFQQNEIVVVPEKGFE